MVDTDAAAARCAMRVWTQARRALILTSAALALTATVATSAASAQAPHHRRHCRYAHTRIGATSRHHLQTAVLCLVNQQRVSRGLPRLHGSRRLNRSAQGWTNTMVRADFFSHGADFAARISAVGFDWSTAGENIASGFMTPAAVVRGWMHSVGHCRNILTPDFSFVGTGVSRRGTAGDSGGTWTQDFALPMSAPAPSHRWGPADGCPY
jgi:uncharacterized protein YkwD